MKPAPAKKTAAPVAAPSLTVLSLAEIAGLSIPVTTRMFGDRVRAARIGYAEQGKLVHHLDNCKLPKGTSIYGLLQKEAGVSEGSVHAARMVADLIADLVVTGLLPEARFDDVISFRIAKHARALLKGTAKVKMAAVEIATLLATGARADIGAEMDCLTQHGMTIAAREAAEDARILAETTKAAEDKAAAEAKAKADAATIAAAEAETAKAKADAESLRQQLAAQAPVATVTVPEPTSPTVPETAPETAAEPATTPEIETVPLTETVPETPPEVPVPATEEETEPEDDEDDQEPEAPPALPAPPVHTVTSILDRLAAAIADAATLDPKGIKAVAHYLGQTSKALAATLESLKIAA